MLIFIGVVIWLILGLVAVIVNFATETIPFQEGYYDDVRPYPNYTYVGGAIALGGLALIWVGAKRLTAGLWRAKSSKVKARKELERELADARQQIEDFLHD